MTGDASLLTDLTDCDRMVVVATGAKTRATKMGTMRMKTSLGTVLVLKDVLLVDGMPHTLLSVVTVIRKNPRCRLTFGKGECTTDHDGQPLAKATRNQTDKVFTLALARNDAQAMSITTTTSKSELWHQRAGHLPIAAINRCGALGLGIPSDLALPTAKCECCIQAKMGKVPNPKTHSRIFRPSVDTSSVCGCKYYTVYVDAATHYKIVRFVHSTDATTQLENWKAIMASSQTQTGNKVKVFRSDGGAEYSSADFEGELKRHGIHHESSTPDNQWQNGMAKRAHRSLMEMAMAMLAHAGLARRWWAEAVNTAAFIQNRVVHGPKATATPIHALSGHRAKLDKLRVFGCVAYNMVKDPTHRDKLAPKAAKCVFMGYAEHQRAWKLYDLESKKMTTGFHVTFCEDEFLGDRSKLDDYLVTTDDSDDEEDEGIPTQSTSQPAPPTVEPPDSTPRHQETREAIGAKGSTPSTPRRLFTGHPIGDQSSRPTLRLLDQFKRSDSGPPTHDDRNVMPSGMVLRPRDRLRPPSRVVSAVHGRPTDNPSREQQGVASEPLEDSADANWTIDDSHVAASMTINGIEFACSAMAPPVDVPQSHREAMAMKDHYEWAKAEQTELQQLREAGTWKLVDLPPGRKSIGSRWTYAKKTNAAGEVVRYKARLVCKGFSQVQGVDYLDTFSPVVKMTTVRTCMDLTAAKKLAVLQADADTAFVQAFIDKGVMIYVDQPPGHGDGTDRKMLLIKALYGLKQAALAWFEGSNTAARSWSALAFVRATSIRVFI
ncbi:hypothetical protein Ae201684P_020098 [Aphanomyces euteiches]|nr:hypothetical protein Ae201684P_020098 [Aphanomyces euteiches]